MRGSDFVPDSIDFSQGELNQKLPEPWTNLHKDEILCV